MKNYHQWNFTVDLSRSSLYLRLCSRKVAINVELQSIRSRFLYELKHKAKQNLSWICKLIQVDWIVTNSTRNVYRGRCETNIYQSHASFPFPFSSSPSRTMSFKVFFSAATGVSAAKLYILSSLILKLINFFRTNLSFQREFSFVEQ